MSVYPIDPDVRRIAKRWGLDAALIQAVVQAEGGTLAHLLKAVRCSLPDTKNTDEAIEIACRSAAHAMSDYLKAHYGPQFVQFWAKRWAPVGVENDPTALNANWPVNVIKLWGLP